MHIVKSFNGINVTYWNDKFDFPVRYEFNINVIPLSRSDLSKSKLKKFAYKEIAQALLVYRQPFVLFKAYRAKGLQ